MPCHAMPRACPERIHLMHTPCLSLSQATHCRTCDVELRLAHEIFRSPILQAPQPPPAHAEIHNLLARLAREGLSQRQQGHALLLAWQARPCRCTTINQQEVRHMRRGCNHMTPRPSPTASPGPCMRGKTRGAWLRYWSYLAVASWSVAVCVPSIDVVPGHRTYETRTQAETPTQCIARADGM